MSNFYIPSGLLQQSPFLGLDRDLGYYPYCTCSLHSCERRFVEMSGLVTDMEIAVLKLEKENNVLKDKIEKLKKCSKHFKTESPRDLQRKIHTDRLPLSLTKRQNMCSNPEGHALQAQLSAFSEKLSLQFEPFSGILMDWRELEQKITRLFRQNQQSKGKQTPQLEMSRKSIVDQLKNPESPHREPGEQTIKKRKHRGQVDIMNKLLIKEI